MHPNTRRIVLMPVVASLILSATAGFAEPVSQANQNQNQQTQTSDKQEVTTLQVVRSKDNPADIHLVDYRQTGSAATPTQPTSAPPAQPARSTAPAPIAKLQVAPQPQPQPQVQSQLQSAPKTEAKPAAKVQPKPAAKPAPAPKRTVGAPKPKSPAPASALRHARPAPKRKAVSAPKPNPQKQSIITRVVAGATGLVSRALSWIGTRYIWGGLSTAGVDCSGLTRLIYKSVGVHLPHNARQQYKLGTPIARSSLSPGDLVFFNTSGPISHVGIYIGNNRFVHAANKRRGVRTDSLGSAYYHKRFAGARRYI